MRSVEELTIQAARLVVSTRVASPALFMRHLYVTRDVAEQLLGRLELCTVIAPTTPGKLTRVIVTTAQLPGLIAKFEQRPCCTPADSN
jgi:hypothetical protein